MAIQMPPIPLVEGYALNPVDPVIRSEMESGPPRARRTSYARNDKINVSWLMTDATFAAFRVWFDSDEGAGGGAAWFSMALPIGEYGFRTVDARFASIWQSAPSGTLRWKVTAQLELRYSPVLTALEQQNILLGIMEKDVVLLWAPATQADVLASKIGPDAAFASTGAQYDENGVSLGIVPALHSKGVWVGPGYANLFTAGTPGAQTKTLTAQTYTVWCDAGSVVCGSYGTATAAAPLTFTATAGDCTFTPSGVTKWMLTATVAPMPYVAPGAPVASAAGSTTNGLSWAMSAEMTAALSGACTVAAEVTMGVDGSAPTGNHNILTVDTGNSTLMWHQIQPTYRYMVRSYDGATYASGADGTTIWSRNERHLKVVQTNALGTQFRVGNLRRGIDSVIQWGSWVNFDGSFNPLAALRLAYGNTVPLWVSKVMVSKLGGLTDAQIEERLNA